MKKFEFEYRKKGKHSKPKTASIYAGTKVAAALGIQADTRFKGCHLIRITQVKPTIDDYKTVAEMMLKRWLSIIDKDHWDVRVEMWPDLEHGVRVSEISFTTHPAGGGFAGNSFMSCDDMRAPGWLERWMIEYFSPVNDTAWLWTCEDNLMRALFRKKDCRKLDNNARAHTFRNGS